MRTQPPDVVPSRPRIALLAVGGLVVALLAMGFLRRDAGVNTAVYESGNILGMHLGSDFPRLLFDRDVGYLWFVVLAGLVVVAAQYAGPRRGGYLAAWGTAFTLAVVYVDSLTRWMSTVGGRFTFGMCDDALISMRYARNLAEGRGLVYNLGEHVDGFTNPLWTFIMTLPFVLHMQEGSAPLPITVLGGGLLIAAALLGRAVLVHEGAPIPVQVLCAFAIFLDSSSLEFAMIGLETPLLTMAATLVVYASGAPGRERLRRPRLVWLGLAVLCLARADGAVVAGILVAWLAWDDACTTRDALRVVARRQATNLAVVVACGLGLVVWRLSVYGHPAPNTAYLKVYPIAGRLMTGLAAYGVRGATMYGVPSLAVICLGGLDARTRRARRLLVPVGLLWLYAIYIGGDAFNYLRFLGPVTPLLWIALGMTLSTGWLQRSRPVNALAFVTFAMVVPIRTERGVLGLSLDHDAWMNVVLSAAKSVEANVPPDATVAIFYAGIPFYAPNHRFVDVLGKTEEHIAHEGNVHGAIPGHNKFDFAWVYGSRKPDVTFTSYTCDQVERFLALPDDEQRRVLEHEQSHRYFFQAATAQIMDPTFRALYAPHRVVLRENGRGVGHPLGCWFVRDGAPVPIVWELARK
ncbi:MAG: hypothetical protein JWP97_2078 [Labilithrix sp.]|nr:hypothetical protein [Labilithrix sp.]